MCETPGCILDTYGGECECCDRNKHNCPHIKKSKWRVTFSDVIEAEDEDDAYAELLRVLRMCVEEEDVTPFEVEEIV